MAKFVNPYTFVPLIERPARDKPAGHDRLASDGLSGSLSVLLTARTPLLVGGFGDVDKEQLTAEEGDGPVQGLPRRADGTVILPGAGLLGAIRSLHEALVGGCLRVLDEEYLPVHRHQADPSTTRDLCLAVVLAVDEAGRPQSVALAAETARVPLTCLTADASGRLPHTGDRLTIAEERIRTSNNRRVVIGEEEVPRRAGLSTELDGSWALLMSDTRARSGDRKAFFTAAKMGPRAETYKVDDSAWETFLDCVAGAEDLRVFRRSNRREPTYERDRAEVVPVCWPPPDQAGQDAKVVGYRLPARPYLVPGQPVWVRTSGGTVTELRLSQLWRRRGNGPVKERVREAKPCKEPDRLCPSCRVFGSIDPYERDDDEVSRQRSYRGHVRVDEAVAVGPVKGVPWFLAPLSSPRPSAGQFYLDNRKAGMVAVDRDPTPLASWGSAGDNGGFRSVRGRKFYWRTTEPDQPMPPQLGSWPRGAARPHHSKELTKRIRLIPAGTRFVTRVSFDNLTEAQLGGLLAALAPGLLLDGAGREIVTSVGGGKPFGFGAVSTEVQVQHLDSADSRYLGGDPPTPTVAELLRRFEESVPYQVRAGWPALTQVLSLGAVDDELVWYPPGTGVKGEESYDQGFEFWQRSAGVTLGTEVRPLTALPRPDDPDQLLDSVVKSVRLSDETGRGARKRSGR